MSAVAATKNLLHAAREAGLRVDLAASGEARLSGPKAAYDHWLPVLRTYKAALVQALRDEAEAVLPAPAASLQAPPAPPARASEAAEAEALAAGADLACWPHSSAMTSQEIGTFIERERLFRARGLTAEIAEALADKLVLRDREGDERRLCLECRHLQGFAGRWRCGNWQRAEVTNALARDLVFMPQRCDGYSSQTPAAAPA